MIDQSLVYVGKLGKTVGLTGALKLHSDTDFQEQFKPKKVFQTKLGMLTVKKYDTQHATITFEEFATPEDSKKLVNIELFTTQEATLAECKLEENEFFWFDVIDSLVYEDDRLLGRVRDIERLPISDYLVIETDKSLIEVGYAKSFLLPYIEHYILQFDKSKKRVFSRGGLDILEAS